VFTLLGMRLNFPETGPPCLGSTGWDPVTEIPLTYDRIDLLIEFDNLTHGHVSIPDVCHFKWNHRNNKTSNRNSTVRCPSGADGDE